MSLLCEDESYVSAFTVKMWAGFMPQWWDVFQLLNFHLWMRWKDVVLDMVPCRQCHLVLAIPRGPIGRCWSTFVGKVVLKRQRVQLHICVLGTGGYFPAVGIDMNWCFDLRTSFSSLLLACEQRCIHAVICFFLTVCWYVLLFEVFIFSAEKKILVL